MCARLELDVQQKKVLKACIEESEQPNRSLFARLKTSLTMILIGMHSTSTRIPVQYDKNNKPF